jgi:Ca-activated chloride channel family protein
MQANIRLEHELLAVETEQSVHAMLELTAPAAPAGRERPPLHLALVVDRSGSMAGDKLETTKRCAAFLVERLAPTDQFALIDYDDQVRLLAPLAPVGGANLLPVIGWITPGGQTNLSGGWLKGMEVLKGATGPGARKVLLLTDGLANVGITDEGALVKMAASAQEAGIGTTTIGFGEGFAEDLLTAMADAGGGNAHYAATPEDAPGIFASEFEDLVSLVAQNVSVEIRPSDQVEVVGMLNEYPAVPVAGGVQLQLGDAYAEERRRVVFELGIPRLASLGVAKVADVVVRYVSVDQEVAAHELTLPIVVNMVSADEAKTAGADQEVVEEVLILKAARAQDEARKLTDAGEFEAAGSILRQTASELRQKATDAILVEEFLAQADALEANVGMMSGRVYDMGSRKQMLYQSRTTRRGHRPQRG